MLEDRKKHKELREARTEVVELCVAVKRRKRRRWFEPF